MFTRYTISNHPDYYEAWPDVALCPDQNRMVCLYIEKTRQFKTFLSGNILRSGNHFPVRDEKSSPVDCPAGLL